MSKAVCYLMSGKPHLPYLCVSLYTLRRHWDGPVCVYAYPESFELVDEITSYFRLTYAYPWEPRYQGKNGQFINKILLMQEGPRDVNCYIDADTIINGKIDPLFDHIREVGFVSTQWNDWLTSGRMVSKRVNDLRQFPEIPDQVINYAIDPKYGLASVNGGVFACRPESPVLQTWYDWTMAAKSTFIADEKVLHLMSVVHPTTFVSLRGGAYNCSPKYKPANLRDEDVVIWHGHGDCWARPDKSQKGYDLWWPIWQECLARNIGGCNDWWRDCGNKWLNRLDKEPVNVS